MTAPRLEKLRHFIHEVDRLHREHHQTAPLLDAVAPRRAALVRDDDWLPEEYTLPHPHHYQQYLLHADSGERFSSVSFVWGPGQATPIHDHRVWGAIGMLRGADKRFFDRIRRCVIACLDDDFDAPEGVSGDVCDLRGGDLAVRKIDELVVWGGDLRVEHTDLPHGAGFSADLDEIADLEGARREKNDGAGEIGKRVLNGKRDG